VEESVIVDCFTFNDEVDLLAYRLTVLSGTVDWHVLVEAPVTFSGRPKALHYCEHAPDFEVHRVLPVIAKNMPSGEDPWEREHHQRNTIDRALVFLADDDLLLISDVDEVPDPFVVEALRNDPYFRVGALVLDGYYWDVEHRVPSTSAPKAIRFSEYRDRFDRSPQAVREASVTLIGSAGWHLSFFGDAARAARKIRDYSHHRELGEHADERLLAERRAAGVGPYGEAIEHLPLARNPRPPPRLDLLAKLTR
jgi:beta-1,4-mannosyl-glycoprotein beta-1,4-N-acetylglucosaminyltransferase